MDFTSDAKMICEAVSALAASSSTTNDVFGNYHDCNDDMLLCIIINCNLDISVLFQTV